MRLEELDFDFPEELIAQRPTEPRDACRLLVVDRFQGELSERVFRDLPGVLQPGDLLVLNDSRVLPARVDVRKATGGRVELLFLREMSAGEGPAAGEGEVWEALARPSGRLRPGLSLLFPAGEEATLLEHLGEGRWLVSLPPGVEGVELLELHGAMPLPPYIKTVLGDPSQYQTVFAATPGSAAAPTAGLHFTPELLERLRQADVVTARVTLHVGLDTFRPVTTEKLEDHQIHREAYSVSPADLARLDQARADGRRIVAVGTTSVRVLETLYAARGPGQPASGPARGHTALFITPGYRFQAVDALITNFHLPRTSLLALVMAFAGRDLVRRAYAVAVKERYRFFSFGDAMLIHGRPRHGSADRVAGRGNGTPADWGGST